MIKISWRAFFFKLFACAIMTITCGIFGGVVHGLTGDSSFIYGLVILWMIFMVKIVWM